MPLTSYSHCSITKLCFWIVLRASQFSPCVSTRIVWHSHVRPGPLPPFLSPSLCFSCASFLLICIRIGLIQSSRSVGACPLSRIIRLNTWTNGRESCYTLPTCYRHRATHYSRMPFSITCTGFSLKCPIACRTKWASVITSLLSESQSVELEMYLYHFLFPSKLSFSCCIPAAHRDYFELVQRPQCIWRRKNMKSSLYDEKLISESLANICRCLSVCWISATEHNHCGVFFLLFDNVSYSSDTTFRFEGYIQGRYSTEWFKGQCARHTIHVLYVCIKLYEGIALP